jgi:hypothetical protein
MKITARFDFKMDDGMIAFKADKTYKVRAIFALGGVLHIDAVNEEGCVHALPYTDFTFFNFDGEVKLL